MIKFDPVIYNSAEHVPALAALRLSRWRARLVGAAASGFSALVRQLFCHNPRV